ncbi:MAG: hypothetical protein GW778_08800, partial [Alphaproteobacteria bacterium]|nr:hypothetical protein [Alphaproteobacteria bacterium]
MSDIFEILDAGKKQSQEQVCRVAYTLNNSQPVICTIIDEQPLFYMDYESNTAAEDEGIFEDADFAILENELRNLKHEMESLENFSTGSDHTQEQTIEKFLEDKDFMFAQTQESHADIADLIETLKTSRLANAYLDCAAQYGVDVAYNAQIENGAYDRKNAKIFINPTLNDADQILIATQELRRHFQHRQGALIHPLMFHPDNAVLINRAQICDLVVSMIRVAWELQLAGRKDVWARIENSSMADLGRAFAREAYLDFRTINNGEASAAVFEAWFLSERCRSQDKILIQQMLSDYQGYVFDLKDTTQSITPTLISALGEMPFGKNYLAEHALTIMNDPIFSDIRDRSNANFLWFIKFERSFRETEHELQSDSHLASDTRSDHHKNKTQDETYGFTTEEDFAALHGTSAQIITLFAPEGSESKDKKSGDKSHK